MRHQPDSKVFRFQKNKETGIYEKTEGREQFSKIPDELFIDEIRHPEKIVAEKIIRGRERVDKTYKFQTGIRPIGIGTYYGDHYEFKNGKKVNSFVLFRFLSGGESLEVHFFNAYKLFPRVRKKFASSYLQSLTK